MNVRRVSSLVSDTERVVWIRGPDGEWREEGGGLLRLGSMSEKGRVLTAYITRVLNEGALRPESVRWATRAARRGRPMKGSPLTTLEAACLHQRPLWEILENRWRYKALAEDGAERMARRLTSEGRRIGAEYLWQRGLPWRDEEGNNVLLGFLANHRRWAERPHPNRGCDVREWTLQLDPPEAEEALHILRQARPDPAVVCLDWARLAALVAAERGDLLKEWCSEADGRPLAELHFAARSVSPGKHTAGLAPLLDLGPCEERLWVIAKMEASSDRLTAYGGRMFPDSDRYAGVAVLPLGTELALAPGSGRGRFRGTWAEDSGSGDAEWADRWVRFWAKWAEACGVGFAGRVF